MQIVLKWFRIVSNEELDVWVLLPDSL